MAVGVHAATSKQSLLDARSMNSYRVHTSLTPPQNTAFSPPSPPTLGGTGVQSLPTLGGTTLQSS
ncbi:MAG TPA: hypothetical protein DDZ80_03180, partial [Cyanobacteria bacterium UBA8803]|nr:hypothetical protein [Cyanobacteria bacterium UBA8803]